MEDINEFFERYRPELLAYLDGNFNPSSKQPGPLEFVDLVLESWANFTEGRTLGEPTPQERTFWFALYQVEDLLEYPATEKLDPYEALLMQNLATVREILRDGGELPEGLFATRPGEDPGDF